jgi:hypothetical protein
MSKLVAFAAIQGAYNIVSKAEGIYNRALEQYGPEQKLEFPNTAYYLPIIYSLLGIPVKDLGSAKKALDVARKLLPSHVQNFNHLPYLGPCWTRAWRPFSQKKSWKPSVTWMTPTSTCPPRTAIWITARSGWARRTTP